MTKRESRTPIFDHGQWIGPYKILRELGQGGMGSVYLAEQRDPVERKVAIKILRAAADSPVSRARFNIESRALALMNHPNIATVIDANSTSTGHPYIVMEYVEGESLLDFCDKRSLTVNERIEVFMGVLDAIQHAHQKGILHRDIKPGNVIVCEHEGEAIPKIIDFGTAKALDTTQTNMKRQTAEGLVVGTPMYMSPEQITGLDSQVDVRTDIYALGVLLYELLAGVSALNTENMSQIHMFHTILNVEPEPPSRRIADVGQHVLSSRSIDRANLERSLKGDLDWIIMKAIDKEPSRRYGSSSELIMDLNRYRKKEPVSAGPPTRIYKLKKFMIRNRVWVGFSILVFVLLLGGTFGTTIGMMKALKAKKQAESSEQVAVQTLEYLQKIIASADPFKDGGRIGVQELLEKAASGIEQDLKGAPQVEAAMRFTLGWTFLELGRYEVAERELELSRQLQVSSLGPEHPDTMKTMNALGRLAYKQGDYPKARSILQANWEREKKVLGEGESQTIWSQYTLGKTLNKIGETKQAESMLRDVLALRFQIDGPEHPNYLVTLNSLCLVLSQNGKLQEARDLQTKAHETLRRVLGETHPNTLNSASNLARILLQLDKWRDARILAAQTLEQQARILGKNHPETLSTLYALGSSQFYLGDIDQAEANLTTCLNARKQTLGSFHPDTLITSLALADIHAAKNRTSEALEAYIVTFEKWEQMEDSEHFEQVTGPLFHFIEFLEQQNQHAKAREYLQRMDKKLMSNQEKEQVRQKLESLGTSP